MPTYPIIVAACSGGVLVCKGFGVFRLDDIDRARTVAFQPNLAVFAEALVELELEQVFVAA
jgi:hypothetical protein